jgi:hypothetical protein
MSAAAVLRQRSLVAVTGPLHGLGNRVRVVLGARSLARLENRAFFYTWSTGRDFGARFNQLWAVDDPVISRRLADALSLRYPYRDHELGWLNESARAKRVIQIRTPHALALPGAATPWETELQSLAPVEAVSARIRPFFSEHFEGRPFVGVMARAHPRSHTVTLRESPLSWYVQRMREIRAEHPDMVFFVSADTVEAQRHLIEEVPGSFGLTDKGGYNTLQALQASVTDLYLLAASTHVLAPHYSSFPELAQKLAGPALLLETSHSDASSRFGPQHPVSRVNDPLRPQLRLPA